ncbi:MAG TPA: regulator SirB [Halothiobacillus sp.]|nr:regulator SirB [Halothiobacillus sp.]
MATAKIFVHIHALTVVLSLIGFVLRGIWMLKDSPMLKAKWVRITPHMVDTLLLVSALIAAYLLYWQYGVHPDFLTVKTIGTLVYIGLGFVALRFGKTKAIRASAWALAIVLFLYLMTVSSTKSAMPFTAHAPPTAQVQVA